MFFDIFSELCDKKGVSCKRAAEDIGLSNSITTKWKKTGATPSGKTLNKIANYFGVSISELLGKEEKVNSPSEFVLTEGEKKLILLFRKLPADLQESYPVALEMTLKAQGLL